jgi:Tfp pilus assembly protein PilX
MVKGDCGRLCAFRREMIMRQQGSALLVVMTIVIVVAIFMMSSIRSSFVRRENTQIQLTALNAQNALNALNDYYEAQCWALQSRSIGSVTPALLVTKGFTTNSAVVNAQNPASAFALSMNQLPQSTVLTVTVTLTSVAQASLLMGQRKLLSPAIQASISGKTVVFSKPYSRSGDVDLDKENDLFVNNVCF